MYVFDKRKENETAMKNRIQLNRDSSVVVLFKPTGSTLEPVLRIKYGAAIPRNLKPDLCSCKLFETELDSFIYKGANQTSQQSSVSQSSTCVACLDWGVRANLRIYMDKEGSNDDDATYCYNFKWQSYDSLYTPLLDCFIAEDEHWFGLGDVQSPESWPLDNSQFDSTPLNSNLTAEFFLSESVPADLTNQSNFGSHVEPTLFSTKGIFIGDIKTDFEPAFKFHPRSLNGFKKLCLSTSCTDKCTQSWLRSDHLKEFKNSNNILEYRICTASSVKKLVSDKISRRLKRLAEVVSVYRELSLQEASTGNNQSRFTNDQQTSPVRPNYLDSVARETSNNISSRGEPLATRLEQSLTEKLSTTKPEVNRDLPAGIGLIERTIFATSLEFMPILDGQILRQYVDNIVKLDLKSSSILLIDTRWETYVGSLALDGVAFPRPKLLFEILHNKGFKIVFTIKPYIDAAVGIGNLNQLLEAGRLYKASSVPRDAHFRIFGSRTKGTVSTRDYVVRRRSLFRFENTTIEIGSNDTSRFPFLYRCKESREGFCVLLDLNSAQNRAWLANNIKRSSLLSLDADGIQLGGSHPNQINWVDHYRRGMSELARDLFYKEKLFVIPQWTGDLGYIQLAPRDFNWNSLRSVVNSVINLNSIGYSLVHPGSVWGDLKSINSLQADELKSGNRISNIYGNYQPGERAQEELAIRWLQVSVFLPILQFNNIGPIQRFGLHGLLQNLIKIRRQTVVPEMKRNLPYCPLVNNNIRSNVTSVRPMPLIRPVWSINTDGQESLVQDQFSIGSEIIVAPILNDGQRQRDIFLPIGFWRDELGGTIVRGGKWLRNYPVELTDVAWFVREKR